MTEVSKFSEHPLRSAPSGIVALGSPQPPAPWSGVLDAFQATTPCPQTGQYASLDEDCLYLNVFVPFRYANNKLPSWYGSTLAVKLAPQRTTGTQHHS
jgi:carboxylesterase type B